MSRKPIQSIEQRKAKVMAYCQISGQFSVLEVCVIASGKLGITLNGSHKVTSLLNRVLREIDKLDKPPQAKKGRRHCKTSKEFYSSRAWKILRYQAFEKYGNRCQCCGAMPNDGITLHVDHVKPRSTNPHLALDLNNLQILCEDCNVGKLNQYETDWRNHWESI